MHSSKTRLSAAGALAIVVMTSALSTPAAAAETVDCSRFTTPVTQHVNPKTASSLVTRWKSEASIASASYGYTQDLGVLSRVANRPTPGATLVWRHFRAGDFVWATQGAESDALIKAGYARQSADFYASMAASPCLAPIYRLKRNTMHRLATEAGATSLVRGGWTRERVAFYAAPAQTTPPPTDPVPPPAGSPASRFSFAVIPDTQNEVMSSSDPRFRSRAAWLVANRDALNLKYAFQIGDLANWGQVDPAQFTRASADLKVLESAMPWSGAIGNHDTGAVCVGGSACPGANASVTVRNTSAYNKAFPVSRFPNVRGTFEAGKIDNAYQTFRAGNVDWLALNLELWPRAQVVAWAKKVVAAHPKHNVIVVTHHYLNADGSISRSNGGYGATSPQYLFDNLIKVYPNVKIVLSGHVGNSAVRTDVGVNGNKITSLLECFHSVTNPVRIVNVDTAAGSIRSTVYAPLTKTSYPQWSTATSGVTFVR